jgi:hypothetical protein
MIRSMRGREFSTTECRPNAKSKNIALTQIPDPRCAIAWRRFFNEAPLPGSFARDRKVRGLFIWLLKNFRDLSNFPVMELT